MTMQTADKLTVVPATEAHELVDRNELVSRLLELRGAEIMTFRAETDPKMRKTDNPFVDNVLKIAKTNGMVNFHYDAGVLRRLEKEGKDASEFNKGGSFHMPVLSDDGLLTPIAIHKEDAAAVVGWDASHTNIKNGRPVGADGKNINLADCKVNPFHASDLEKASNPRLYLRYMRLSSKSMFVRKDNDVEVDRKALEPFLYVSDYANQGLDNPLEFLTYGIDNIVQMSMDKSRLIVKP